MKNCHHSIKNWLASKFYWLKNAEQWVWYLNMERFTVYCSIHPLSWNILGTSFTSNGKQYLVWYRNLSVGDWHVQLHSVCSLPNSNTVVVSWSSFQANLYSKIYFYHWNSWACLQMEKNTTFSFTISLYTFHISWGKL